MRAPLFLFRSFGSTSKIIEADVSVIHTKRVEQVEDGLGHHRRTAEVVLDILGSVMLLEVGVAHDRSDEARGVLDTQLVGLRVRTIQREVEMEVGELLLQREEILEEEDFVDSTSTVEIVHLTVAALAGLEHVHDLRTQRSHTGSTTDPDHLLLAVINRTELTVRTAHANFIPRFEREDIGRSDTAGYIHELRTIRALLFGFERRRGDTHGKGDDIALVGIVSHGVRTYGCLGVLLFEFEQAELLPSGQVEIADERLIHVAVVVDIVLRDDDLCVRTRFEVHVLARRQLYLELLDEGSDVLVRDDFALPFLDTQNRLIDLHGDVFFHFDLATQTPSFFLLFAREMDGLGRQNLAATGEYLALTLTARALTAASRGQVNTGFAVLVEERTSGCHVIDLVAVDGNFDVTGGNEVFLSHQEDSHEQEDHNEEHSYSI